MLLNFISHESQPLPVASMLAPYAVLKETSEVPNK